MTPSVLINMATTTNSNFFHQPPLPPARTPLPASKPGEASIKQNEDQHIAIITSESLEIQVPSTQSPSGSIHEEEMSPRPSSPRKGEPDHLSSVNRTDVAEDEDQTVRTPKVDHNANLPAMNWAEFEARFATAQDQASTAEDELFDEFDKLAVVGHVQSWRCWGRAG